jgi:hypothetical protein
MTTCVCAYGFLVKWEDKSKALPTYQASPSNKPAAGGHGPACGLG